MHQLLRYLNHEAWCLIVQAGHLVGQAGLLTHRRLLATQCLQAGVVCLPGQKLAAPHSWSQDLLTRLLKDWQWLDS